MASGNQAASFARERICVEELHADGAETKNLDGFGVTRTVADLKKAVAEGIGRPGAWESVELFSAGVTLNDSQSMDHQTFNSFAN
jgi:hypothetical protein